MCCEFLNTICHIVTEKALTELKQNNTSIHDIGNFKCINLSQSQTCLQSMLSLI